MMYVYREFNQTHFDPGLVESTKRSLRAWDGVADKLIAIVNVGSVPSVRKWLSVSANNPLPYVMGIKAAGIQPRFHTPLFWDAVADAQVFAPKGKPFVLDLETYLTPWHDTGVPKIPLAELAASLGPHATAKYWYYCCDVLKNWRAYTAEPNREKLTCDLAETLGRTTAWGSFLHGYAATPAKLSNAGEQRRWSKMANIVGGDRMIPIYNVLTTAGNHWSPKQWIKNFGQYDDSCAVNPGVENFEACGNAMRKAYLWNVAMGPARIAD